MSLVLQELYEVGLSHHHIDFSFFVCEKHEVSLTL